MVEGFLSPASAHEKARQVLIPKHGFFRYSRDRNTPLPNHAAVVLDKFLAVAWDEMKSETTRSHGFHLVFLPVLAHQSSGCLTHPVFCWGCVGSNRKSPRKYDTTITGGTFFGERKGEALLSSPFNDEFVFSGLRNTHHISGHFSPFFCEKSP